MFKKEPTHFLNLFFTQETHRLECFKKYNVSANETNAVGEKADRYNCAIVCANGDHVSFIPRL